MAEHLYNLMKKKLLINGQELENEEDQIETYDEMSVFIKKQLRKQVTTHEEFRKVFPIHVQVDEDFFKKVENLKKYFQQLEDKFVNSKEG